MALIWQEEKKEEAQRQTITLKAQPAFQPTFTFKANAPNKSNDQQVNTTCFETEPLEKHIPKVTGPGVEGSDVIDLNCITDDWSATNHVSAACQQ